MRAKLLASTALAGMLVATPVAKAQFAVIDVANLQQNVQQTLQQVVQTQSLSAEAIEDVLGNVEESLAKSQGAVGQTQAVQVGNQISAQIATILAQIQGSQLAAQRLQALQLAHEASLADAADDARERFHEEDAFIGRDQGILPEGWQ